MAHSEACWWWAGAPSPLKQQGRHLARTIWWTIWMHPLLSELTCKCNMASSAFSRASATWHPLDAVESGLFDYLARASSLCSMCYCHGNAFPLAASRTSPSLLMLQLMAKGASGRPAKIGGTIRKAVLPSVSDLMNKFSSSLLKRGGREGKDTSPDMCSQYSSHCLPQRRQVLGAGGRQA